MPIHLAGLVCLRSLALAEDTAQECSLYVIISCVTSIHILIKNLVMLHNYLIQQYIHELATFSLLANNIFKSSGY